MKLNKKIAICAIFLAFFSLALVGFPNKANAGGGPIAAIVGSLLPFIPPEVIGGAGAIIDYNSCSINIIWGCDENGNPLSGPSAGNNSPYCTPTIDCAPTTAVGQTCNNGCNLTTPGTMSVDLTGPALASYNTPFSLNWTVTGSPVSCTASGGWSGDKSISGGSEQIASIAVDTTFTITCLGTEGSSATDSVTVKLPPLPSGTLTATPSVIVLDATHALPQPVTLNWNLKDAISCVKSWDNQTLVNPATGNDTAQQNAASVVYKLSCDGAGGGHADIFADAAVTTVCYSHTCGNSECNETAKSEVLSYSACKQTCSSTDDCTPRSPGTWIETSP